MVRKSKKEIFIALTPLVVLLLALFVNVRVMGDEAGSGGNQIILIGCGLVAAILGVSRGVFWQDMIEGVERNVASTAQAIIILLLIGSLAGTWMAGGIVPAMIYYGMEMMHPSYFLPATAIITAVVSLVTGSSWSTTATVGIALMAVGSVLGISPSISAGAVISGAYFGDKLSPLSDTTNLAAAMAGTDVISHIKYLLLTTIPSFVIAILIFSGISLYHGSIDNDIVMNGQIQVELKEIYNLSLWLFLIPVLVIVLIAKKMPAIPALAIGVVGGVVSMLVFQNEQFGLNEGWTVLYRNIHDVVLTDYVPAGVGGSMEELLATSGMQGMLSTIWLILSAMFFGGIMEACGFLNILTNAMLKSAESDAAVFTATAASAVVVNVSASDQYLSIVIPGRMFAGSFAERGLAPENLSRTLEDAGTVTSVLIPWNTCGAYQSRVLGVDAFSYLPYAFFNLLSPFMTLIFAWFKIRIKRK